MYLGQHLLKELAEERQEAVIASNEETAVSVVIVWFVLSAQVFDEEVRSDKALYYFPQRGFS